MDLVDIPDVHPFTNWRICNRHLQTDEPTNWLCQPEGANSTHYHTALPSVPSCNGASLQPPSQAPQAGLVLYWCPHQCTWNGTPHAHGQHHQYLFHYRAYHHHLGLVQPTPLLTGHVQYPIHIGPCTTWASPAKPLNSYLECQFCPCS